MGGKPSTETYTKSKKGNSWKMTKLTFHDKREVFEISLENEKADWLIKTLELLNVNNVKTLIFSQLKTDFEEQFYDFELFWNSKPINTLREFGLLQI